MGDSRLVRVTYICGEIHLANWNQINIPIDVFESNVPIVPNLMCTEAEKKENGFSLGGKGNFAR